MRTLLLNTFHSIMRNYLQNNFTDTMPKAITKKVKEADFPLVFEQPQSEHSVVADIQPHGQDQKIKY